MNKEILDHYLVPKHIILNEKEKNELLQKLNISEQQLPKISINDPIVKLIGAKEGDVIKIIRKSHTAGESIYYRLVVKI
ncbi:MAG: DNA-directed RNA polymerase subunit H [Candidatus Aenigmarchaeota archaeon]|nr:DNA-directed RNA polymerase subunit H [Candidatus Aenigmarchaeota archaeon]